MSPQEYAHLLPAERILWARWLLDHRTDYDAFDYDVRVGEGRPPDPRLSPENQQMWRDLTKRRIDVVGYKAGFPTLFQVAIAAGRKDLGALEMYRDLYVVTFLDRPRPALAWVGERIDPDMERVMKQRGIIVYVLSRFGEKA